MAGANCNKTTCRASCNMGKNEICAFCAVLYLCFLLDVKMDFKVALYWIKVDILKQSAKNFSYMSSGNVDV